MANPVNGVITNPYQWPKINGFFGWIFHCETSGVITHPTYNCQGPSLYIPRDPGSPSENGFTETKSYAFRS